MLVILTLIVVTLSALVLASSQASLQQTTSEKTQDLLLIFQNANTTVSQVFHEIGADGETVPQASIDAYNQALVLAEKSRSLLDAGNYSEADEKIVQALQKLKEALRIVYEVIPEQPTESELSLERVAQLGSSIRVYKPPISSLF
jgi:23S rRNA G2069 N7-methylase RlmK/C1962 C5-methylase RlmI